MYWRSRLFTGLLAWSLLLIVWGCTTKFESNGDDADTSEVAPDTSEDFAADDGAMETDTPSDGTEQDALQDSVEELPPSRILTPVGTSRSFGYASPIPLDIEPGTGEQRVKIKLLLLENTLILFLLYDSFDGTTPYFSNSRIMVFEIAPSGEIVTPPAINEETRTPKTPHEVVTRSADVEATENYVYLFQAVRSHAGTTTGNIQVTSYERASLNAGPDIGLIFGGADIADIPELDTIIVTREGQEFYICTTNENNADPRVFGMTFSESELRTIVMTGGSHLWSGKMTMIRRGAAYSVVLAASLARKESSSFVGTQAITMGDGSSSVSIPVFQGTFRPGAGPDHTVELCTTEACGSEPPMVGMPMLVPSLLQPALTAGWITSPNTLDWAAVPPLESPIFIHAAAFGTGEEMVMSEFDSGPIDQLVIPSDLRAPMDISDYKLFGQGEAGDIIFSWCSYGDEPDYPHVNLYPLDRDLRPLSASAPDVIPAHIDVDLSRFYGYDSVYDPLTGRIHLAWNMWYWEGGGWTEGIVVLTDLVLQTWQYVVPEELP